jgi:transcriptional regulator with XRE-family HTH domain
MSRLGEYLKELRGDLSLYEVQKGTGLSRNLISLYESAKQVPTIPTLKKLSEFYEVPYRHLRKLSFEDLYSDPEDRSIILEWAEETKVGGYQ